VPACSRQRCTFDRCALHLKADIILELLGGDDEEKNTKLDADFWRRDAEMKRLLEERIAYHKAKIAEERDKL